MVIIYSLIHIITNQARVTLVLNFWKKNILVFLLHPAKLEVFANMAIYKFERLEQKRRNDTYLGKP